MSKWILCILMIFCTNQIKGYAQAFFPTNFPSIVYTEDVEKSGKVRFNDTYLSQKGFIVMNDSICINNQTKEVLQLSQKHNDQSTEISIDYYMIVNDLGKLSARLKDIGLNKVSNYQYEKQFDLMFF